MCKWIEIKKPLSTALVVDIYSKAHGRLANYKFVRHGKGNSYFTPVDGGYSCVRDATHYMLPPEPPEQTK